MKKAVVLLLICGLAVSASAVISVTNGDFEIDTVQSSDVTGWYEPAKSGTSNWWESTWVGPNVSPTGTSVLGLSYMFAATNWAYQGIGVNTEGLTSLTLSFDVGSFTDAGSVRDLGVTVSLYESDGTFIGADGTDVDGAAGIALVDSVSVLNTLASGTYTNQTVTLDLTAAGSGELFLRLVNYAGQTGEPWTAIDNVQIVPEPVTLALLGLGGLLARRKR